ncbi:MAG: nitrilase-related carbon-nitrogen hydrolase [Bacillota bacterium]
MFRAALIQMACSGSRKHNVDKAASLIDDAVGGSAEVICLQEVFSSRYFPQEMKHESFDMAEPVTGPTVSTMQDISQSRRVTLIVPFFEKVMEGLFYNTAAVIESGSLLGLYRKNHIPDEPGYCEKFYFKPGDLGYPVFRTRLGRIGVGICWDQWFPETGRSLALNGAEMVFFPSAIGGGPSHPEVPGERVKEMWTLANRAQACMNLLWVGVLNRVGQEGDIRFFGGSFFANPLGEVTVLSSRDGDEVVMGEIDLECVRKARRWWPYFRDRRTSTYGRLLE